MSLQDSFEILTNSEIKKFRESLPQKCCICGSTEKLCLDHQHKRISDELGVNGCGLIRGLLCNSCNQLEGKIWNNIKRYGKVDETNPTQSRVGFLQKLIDYYNNNIQHTRKIVHPSEKPIEKISKSTYNKIVKGVSNPPKFTGRWTKQLKLLQEKYDEQNSR